MPFAEIMVGTVSDTRRHRRADIAERALADLADRGDFGRAHT